MRVFVHAAICGVGLIAAQPAMAATVTLGFSGLIGPFTTPATLAGGAFDGTIRFDDAQPFATQPATLTVVDGPLANIYTFGGTPGAFVAAAYRNTYDSSMFRFQGTSDDGASLTFNLTGNGSGGYSGSFSFAKGSDFAAVGNAVIGNATALPEPSTWLVMIAGFGMIGGALRHAQRRRQPVAA